MFSDNQLDQARSAAVLEIAERHSARLKKRGAELVGPCPVCGGREDKLQVNPSKNAWYCRGPDKGGDSIALEMHLSGSPFVDAVGAVIDKNETTPPTRRPRPEELATKAAERKRQQFIEATAAEIIAGIVPMRGTLAERYLGDIRLINVEKLRDILERTDAIGFHNAVYLKEPGHPLHGQFLPAIIAIQTDPLTGARTGGISRTYLSRDGRKLVGLDGKSMKAKSLGPMGVVRLSRDEDVLSGLHSAEGLETALSAMDAQNYRPMWSMGSKSIMAKLPVLPGVECLTVCTDNDESGDGERAASEVCQRWANAGREAQMVWPKNVGDDFNDLVRRRRTQ